MEEKTFDASSREGRELLAPLSKVLALPEFCTFEPLRASPIKIDISSGGASFFTSHQAMLLPCDHLCTAARGRQVQGMADTIHKFCIDSHRAGALNAALARWALKRARAAEIRSPDGEVEELNVQKSNWGVSVAGCEPAPVLSPELELDRLAASAS
jgi:hypothetical protein